MTNNKLIEHMLNTGFLRSERIADAFQKIDRKDFVGEGNTHFAYVDEPLRIGQGQTISQPSTVAFMLEKLGAKPGDSVLDVGSGSGWTTALLAEIVRQNGRVLGVERIPDLVEFGQKNIKKYDFSNASIEKAGLVIGAPERGPYDRMLISAASDGVPNQLIDQLKAGGTMVIPVMDSIEVIKKSQDGSINQEAFHGFRFVPLFDI